MAAVTASAVVKKALEALVSNKKGRKFLGYVIGIAVFLVLLPVIVIFGLFGFMSNSGNLNLDNSAIVDGLSSTYQERFKQADAVCKQITDTFTERGLSDKQINMAQTIYLSCLVDKETGNETFYDDLADCFIGADKNREILKKIGETFDIEFTKTDIENFTKLFGDE